MKSSPASSANPLSRNPLFAAALAYAFGIFLYLGPGLDGRVFLFAFIGAFVAALLSKKAMTSAVLMAFLVLGGLSAYVEQRGASDRSLSKLYEKGWVISGDPVEIAGILTDHPQKTIDGLFLHLSADSITYKRELIETTGTIRVFVSTGTQESAAHCRGLGLKAGYRVILGLNLKREEPFRNPGTIKTIDSLNWRGIDATGSAKSCFLIEVTGREPSLLSPLFEFREWLTESILRTHDRSTAGVVLASLVGNRNFLTREAGETFRNSGTFHVLVISGLHITLIGGLILITVRRFTKSRTAQFFIASGFLWAYATLVGLQLPVFRAVVMFTVYLLSQGLYRSNSPFNSLGAAVFAILIFRPADLFNPSFQLTCLSIIAITGFAFQIIDKMKATGGWMPDSKRPFPPAASRGILLLSEGFYWSSKRWDDYRSRQSWDCRITKTRFGELLSDTLVQRLSRVVFELACISVSVQIFLLPIVVLRFHRVGTASAISNVFAGTAVAVQNTAALVSILIDVADADAARAFVATVSVVTFFSQALQEVISGNLFPALRIPVYTGAAASVYWLYFVPLVVLAVCLYRWDPFRQTSASGRKTAAFALTGLLLLGIVIVFHPFSRPNADGRLRVDFLDVGQGDSALVTFPDGTTMLIDGGGQRRLREETDAEPDRPGIGERVVCEYLWERGYSTIGYILSTHPDTDHISGLTDVVRSFDTGLILAGGIYGGVEEFRRLSEYAEARGTPIRQVGAGDVFEIGKAEVVILHPDTVDSTAPGNNDSIVMRISFGNHSFLFTGDIEAASERKLLAAGFPLKSAIIKVAHHGSRTSSTPEFVNASTAEYAVISVGKRSPYGHPHKDVVRRWSDTGARVLTTGQSGTITISTDGSDLRINKFLGP